MQVSSEGVLAKPARSPGEDLAHDGGMLHFCAGTDGVEMAGSAVGGWHK